MPKRRGPRKGGPPFKRGGPPRKLPLQPRFAGGTTASVGTVIPLTLALEGDSALGASLVGVRPLSVAMQGSGTMAAAPLVAVRPLALGIVGDGSLAPALVATRTLALGMAGSGALTPALVATRPLSASVAGSGALSASIGALRLLSLGLQGDSAASASLVAVRPVSAQLAGSGALAAQLSPPSLAVSLAGGGAMAFDIVNANMPGGATEPASYRPRYGRIYPAFVQPPAPEPLIIEEVAWDGDFVELEPLPPIGAVAMHGSGALDVVLSVYRPLPTPEPRAPESPEIFPWWEHPTEDELAMLLLLA